MNCTILNENPYELAYCTSPALLPAIIIVILPLLLISLATTSSLYTTPTLSSISQTLSLSPSVSGPLLAALGNTSPDLFTAFTSISSNNPQLALGQVFGGVSCGLLCIGIICILTPFSVHKYSFARDTIFLVVALSIVYGTMQDGIITLAESIGLLIVYAVYGNRFFKY